MQANHASSELKIVTLHDVIQLIRIVQDIRQSPGIIQQHEQIYKSSKCINGILQRLRKKTIQQWMNWCEYTAFLIQIIQRLQDYELISHNIYILYLSVNHAKHISPLTLLPALLLTAYR